MMRRSGLFAFLILAAGSAQAQTPPANAPAKELFGKKQDAAPLKARAIGFYSKGCLAGGLALPVNGKTWQVMRLSRNRNWGHPDLIAYLERFAAKVPKVAGWNGILVGDAHRTRLASSRVGCRHLAHADAEPHAR
jgi:penicillin-insensitive murein endopeptidase